jgi:hypothetical protein
MVSIVLTGIFITFCCATGIECPNVTVQQGTVNSTVIVVQGADFPIYEVEQGAERLTVTVEQGAERPTVTVEQGTLQGVKLSTVWSKEYFAFRGIRYARPPVGKLRFQASWFLYVYNLHLLIQNYLKYKWFFSLTK